MKKYRYVLLSNDEGTRLELPEQPIGWDASKISLIRDFTYLGVFKSITAEFEFVGEGYLFLQRAYLRYGVDADVILRIYEKARFVFEAKVNFQNFQDDRKNRRIGVDLIQSGFVQDFNNREDIKIDLLSRQTLDLEEMPPMFNPTVDIRGKLIGFYGEWRENPTFEEVYHHTIPFITVFNDISEAVNNFVVVASDDVEDNLLISDASFLINAGNVDKEVSVTYDLTFNFQWDGINDPVVRSRNIIRMRGIIRDADDNLKSTFFNQSYTNTFGTFNINGILNATLAPGDYILFICERRIDRIIGGLSYMNGSEMLGVYKTIITYPSVSITVSDVNTFPDTTAPVILPFEMFERLIYKITGEANALVSNIFGRTDLGYDSDGDGALTAITTGNFLRGRVEDTEVTMSFRDAFVSFSQIYNLGLLVNDRTIRIDRKDDLFNNDISTRIGEVKEVIVRPSQDYLFNSILVGYPEQEYEQQTGIDEFNTRVQYTNSVRSVKREEDLTSIFRADGFGIETVRRQTVQSTGTKDLKSDKEIFMLDLVRKEGGGFQTRRLEGVISVSGIFSPETAMNLRISPGQNLLRWQRFLAIPINKKAQQSYFYQTKDKNNSLNVAYPIGVSNDGENIDIVQPPYFLPEQKEFQSTLSIKNILELLANPLGLIAYTYDGENFFDYLLEIDAENESNTGNLKVLSTKPTPIEDIPIEVQLPTALKYDDGFESFIKYGNLDEEILLWQ
jgi:hypothetical protein